jgi:hypothetical protein
MNVFVYSKRVSGAVESASMIHTMPPSGPNENLQQRNNN